MTVTLFNPPGDPYPAEILVWACLAKEIRRTIQVDFGAWHGHPIAIRGMSLDDAEAIIELGKEIGVQAKIAK